MNYDQQPWGTEGGHVNGCTTDHSNANTPSTYDCNNYTTGSIGGRLVSALTILPRHDPAANYLACDGHVKLLRPEKVSCGYPAASSGCIQDSINTAGCQVAYLSNGAKVGDNAASTDDMFIGSDPAIRN